jgi:WD repeat-containing protein 7
MVYLHENDVSCKALAIDLCSRGFNVWQHYIDSMEMLRNLFDLATNTKKESISAQNVGPQARQAVLHIVADNTGVFMTTLSLDILHPQSLEHRKSVMQVVAFLIRKVG